MIKDKKEGVKSLNLRLPHELWKFLKKSAVDREVSLNVLILTELRKYKKRKEDRLTTQDTMAQ